MFTNLIDCECGFEMRLESAMPGNAKETLLLTFHCVVCERRRKFVLSEITKALKLPETK